MEVFNQNLTGHSLPPEAEKARRGVEFAMKQLGSKTEKISSLSELKQANALLGKFEVLIVENSSEQDKEFKRIKKMLPTAELKQIKVKIGDETAEELIKALEQYRVNVSDLSRQTIKSPKFWDVESNKAEQLVKVSLSDLGLKEYTTDEIIEKINKLGLEMCPVKVAVYYQLNHRQYDVEQSLYVPIGWDDESFYTLFFRLDSDEDLVQYWIYYETAHPAQKWSNNNSILLRLKTIE